MAEKKAKILIVDDSEDIVKLLKKAIPSMGLEATVESADNGFDAGMKIKELVPDLVLLDLWLPGLNGFTVCEQIKKDPATAHTKILAMTGQDVPKVKEVIMLCGADDFIQKPFDIEDIAKKIKGLLPPGMPAGLI